MRPENQECHLHAFAAVDRKFTTNVSTVFCQSVLETLTWTNQPIDISLLRSPSLVGLKSFYPVKKSLACLCREKESVRVGIVVNSRVCPQQFLSEWWSIVLIANSVSFISHHDLIAGNVVTDCHDVFTALGYIFPLYNSELSFTSYTRATPLSLSLSPSLCYQL